MSTVKLVAENTDHPKVRAVFDDIKATKKTDRVPDIWRALASNPDHLELCWTRLKAIMRPGKVDLLTKEIVALAVSVTNSCRYCINSHTAAVQRLGLDNEGLGEVLAVVGLFNQMNKLADAYQVEPDILPEHETAQDTYVRQSAPLADRSPSVARQLPSTGETDPDLARVLAAWPGLPEAIRRKVLALVEAAGR
jgi:AhpD family alkylhydroperoxidase